MKGLDKAEELKELYERVASQSVSYTHLTLPTN